jgi:4-hydroxy-3-methylbut-2-enyl diphosphate reductase IspH
VTKVHTEAVRYAAKGFQILLVGHADHQEIVGTRGEAPTTRRSSGRVARRPMRSRSCRRRRTSPASTSRTPTSSSTSPRPR